MAKARLRFSVAGNAMRFLLLAIVLFIILDIVSKYFTISPLINVNFIPVVASFFILLDVGIREAIRSKGKTLDAIDILLGVVALVVLASVVMNLLGMALTGALLTFQAIVEGLLGIAILVSIFKR